MQKQMVFDKKMVFDVSNMLQRITKPLFLSV